MKAVTEKTLARTCLHQRFWPIWNPDPPPIAESVPLLAPATPASMGTSHSDDITVEGEVAMMLKNYGNVFFLNLVFWKLVQTLYELCETRIVGIKYWRDFFCCRSVYLENISERLMLCANKIRVERESSIYIYYWYDFFFVEHPAMKLLVTD